MHRIDGSGHQDNCFTEGNPQTGTEATVVTADWLNAVQEEVAHVIEGQNLALDKDDNEQLKTAVNTAIGQAVANCKTEVAQDRASEIDAAKTEISGLIDQKVDAGIGAVKQRHVIRFTVMGYLSVSRPVLRLHCGVTGTVKKIGCRVNGGTASVKFYSNNHDFTPLTMDLPSGSTIVNHFNLPASETMLIMVNVEQIGGTPKHLAGYIIVEEN